MLALSPGRPPCARDATETRQTVVRCLLPRASGASAPAAVTEARPRPAAPCRPAAGCSPGRRARCTPGRRAQPVRHGAQGDRTLCWPSRPINREWLSAHQQRCHAGCQSAVPSLQQRTACDCTHCARAAKTTARGAAPVRSANDSLPRTSRAPTPRRRDASGAGRARGRAPRPAAQTGSGPAGRPAARRRTPPAGRGMGRSRPWPPGPPGCGAPLAAQRAARAVKTG